MNWASNDKYRPPPNCKLYLSKWRMYFPKWKTVFVQKAKYICQEAAVMNWIYDDKHCPPPNCKLYFSKWRDLFSKMEKCICPNCQEAAVMNWICHDKHCPFNFFLFNLSACPLKPKMEQIKSHSIQNSYSRSLNTIEQELCLYDQFAESKR